MRLGLPISAAFAFVLIATPALPARAQSAFDQLQAACRASGGNCSPNIPDVPEPTVVDRDHGDERAPAKAPRPKPRPPTLTTEQFVKVQLTGMLLEGLFASIFDGAKNDAEAESAAAAAARQQAEAALLQQRAAHVQQQRSSRDAENGRSLEDMAAALSDPWVGRPVAPGSAGPVRLGGSGTVGLFDPPTNPFAKAPAPPSASALASERLARLAAENADVAVLAGRLAELEDRLATAQVAAIAARREMQGASRGLSDAAQELEGAVDAAYERGASLALTTLFHATPKAQARLDEVRSDSRAWNELTRILKTTADPAFAIKDAADRAENLRGDLGQLAAARDYRKDALYLAKRLGGDYAELGGNILASAQSIKASLAARREATGLLQQVEEQRQLGRLDSEYVALVRDVKEARTAVARATGINRKDLVRTAPGPARATGLASEVPHPLDN